MGPCNQILFNSLLLGQYLGDFWIDDLFTSLFTRVSFNQVQCTNYKYIQKTRGKKRVLNLVGFPYQKSYRWIKSSKSCKTVIKEGMGSFSLHLLCCAAAVDVENGNERALDGFICELGVHKNPDQKQRSICFVFVLPLSLSYTLALVSVIDKWNKAHVPTKKTLSLSL